MDDGHEGTTRRRFLKVAGLGVVAAAATGGLTGGLGRVLLGSASAATTELSLLATDGYISVPGREGDPLYIFGFVPVDPALSVAQLISAYKGHAKTTAPTLTPCPNRACGEKRWGNMRTAQSAPRFPPTSGKG